MLLGGLLNMQSTHGKLMRRQSVRYVQVIVLLVSILVFPKVAVSANPQEDNQAGLVIQFGNGDVITRCVSFSEVQITGYQLLERSGLEFEASFDPNLGAFVCSIEGEGCPKNDCQCQVPLYWSYWKMIDGDWVYSVIGVSQATVLPGQIDGWVWGDGSSPPPRVSFEDVCPVEEPMSTFTNTPQPTATETAFPTLTPTSTFTEMPTQQVATNTPTQDALPTETPTLSPTVTSTSAAYPPPVESSTDTPTPLPSSTQTQTPTEPEPSFTPQATSTKVKDVLVLPTQTSTPTMLSSPTVSPVETKTFVDEGFVDGGHKFGSNGVDKLLIFGLLFVASGGVLWGYQMFPSIGEKYLRYGIYVLTTIVGIISFLAPFFPGKFSAVLAGEHTGGGSAFYLLMIVLGISFLVMLVEAQGQAANAKMMAMLGVLSAVNATLRFAEVAFPGPAGFSPIFFLIVLTGYAYGGSIGFLLGVLTMLVSAIITGGVGPWLPAQMLAAGWVGLSAPLVRPLVQKAKRRYPKVEMLALAVFSAGWGLFFGVIMNLWFWPFFSGPSEQYWQPGIGIGIGDTVSRYLAFYLTTSLVWDLFRAVGNFLLVYFFGKPVLRVLRRFKKRFTITYQPEKQFSPDAPRRDV